MDIEILRTDSPPRDLVLLADESQEAVADYIGRGVCYIARLGGEAVGEYVLLPARPLTAEIVNIAVAPACQRRGIGTALIRHAVATARKAGFRRLEIGTGDTGAGQIVLYERCGFVRCGEDRDYFRWYCPTPIIENGVECRHMVRLAMQLR